MKKLVHGIFLAGLFLTAVLLPGAEIQELKNHSFERLSGDLPLGWRMMAFDLEPGTTVFLVEKGNAYEGSYCAVISSSRANDARWMQEVGLQARSIYKLSCRARTENVGATGRGANLSILEQGYSSRDLKGTVTDWEELIFYVVTGTSNRTVTVTLGIGGFGLVNTGVAFFDDVKIEKVTTLPPGAKKADFSRDTEAAAIPPTGSDVTKEKRIVWIKPWPVLFILPVGLGMIILAGILYYILIGRHNRPVSSEESEALPTEQFTGSHPPAEELYPQTDNGQNEEQSDRSDSSKPE